MTSPTSAQGVEILVDGFFDNPVFAWAFPDESRRAEALTGWFEFWLGAYADQGELIVSPEGDGAALWSTPDVAPVDGEALGPLIQLVHEHNGDRAGVVLAGFAALTPPNAPHWYLNTIAARRGQRARGVGARLLEPTLERADRQGIPVYLESSNPRNLSFYHRYGFRDQAPRIDLPEAGPPLQPLLRPVGG